MDTSIEVGVVVSRKELDSFWMDCAWAPYAILPPGATAASKTFLGTHQNKKLFYAGTHEIILHPGAYAYYRDNITSAQPSVWVALRAEGIDDFEVTAITVDPYEGEALTGGLGQVVDAVPMPDGVRSLLLDFIAGYPLERPFLKRQRDTHVDGPRKARALDPVAPDPADTLPTRASS